MITNLMPRFITLFSIALIIATPANSFSEPLPPKEQAVYDSIMQLGREAIQSTQMDRAQFEKRLSAIIAGSDDDQRTAKGSAMVMYDTIEFVHENYATESKFDYSQIFDGTRYKSKEDIVKQQQLLLTVNEITSKTIRNTENTVGRLEEELKRAKVSPARIKKEVDAARQKDKESKAETAHGLQRLKDKIALNEARIKALEFLSTTFGKWNYKDNFIFETKEQAQSFENLMTVVARQEIAFSNAK